MQVSYLRSDIAKLLGSFPSNHQMAVIENASEALNALKTAHLALMNAGMESAREFAVVENVLDRVKYGSGNSVLMNLLPELTQTLGASVAVPETLAAMELSDPVYHALKSVRGLLVRHPVYQAEGGRFASLHTVALDRVCQVLRKIEISVYESQSSVVAEMAKRIECLMDPGRKGFSD